MIRFSSAIFAVALVMFAFAAAQAWRGQYCPMVTFTGAGLFVGVLGVFLKEGGE